MSTLGEEGEPPYSAPTSYRERAHILHRQVTGIRYNESWRSQQHFEYRHGYVRQNTRKVMKDLRWWRSDGMDHSSWSLWRFLQSLEGDWSLVRLSEQLQFRRCDRTWNIRASVLFVWCPEWECPFVGGTWVCLAVFVLLTEFPKYVIFITDYCPSWTLSMTFSLTMTH